MGAKRTKWWGFTDLNRGQTDYESCARPTRAPRNAKKIVQKMCVRWELRQVHRDVGCFVSAETYRMRRPPQSSTGTIASLN